RSSSASSTTRPNSRSSPSVAAARSAGRTRDIRLAYLLLAPTLLLLLTTLAYPIGWEIWTSFTDLSPLKDGSAEFVGLTNYGRLLGDPEFWRAALVTVVYAIITSVARLLAGINAIPPELFECALLESKSRWRRFRLVTVPLLRPFLALAVFLSLTGAFADLANVWMLTAGRIVFPVIGTHAYVLAVKAGQY